MIELATLIIGTTVTSLLTLVIFSKNSKSITNQLFVILAIGLIGWSITTYLSLHTTSSELTLFWIRLIMFFVVLQNTAFFLLVRVFPAVHFDFSHKKPYLGIIMFSLVTAGMSLSPFLFSDFQNGVPVPGPGMPLFMLHALLFVGGGVSLILRYHREKGLVKTQLGYVLIGTLFMFTALPVGNFILPVIFKYNTFVALSPLYSIVFTGFFASAIITKRLFDIRNLVARSVLYIFLLLSLAGIYTGSFLWITNVLLEGKSSITLNGILAIILAFTFQPLRKLIEKSTNKFLFKDSYNTDVEIGKLTKIMASTILLKDLITRLLQELQKSIKFTEAAFIILKKNNEIDILKSNEQIVLQFTDTEISTIKNIQSLVNLDELEEGELKDLLRKHSLSILSSCRTQNEIIAYLCLGNKQSGEAFSEQDLSFIRILSDAVAVAIKNAEAYEEIRKFNITLQDEIEKATKELKQANTQLQDLDNLKDEFVSLASHELRTPMAAIKGSLSTILEGYAGPISNDSKEFLSAAYNENDRLIRLVNNLLNTSRIESGRLSFTIAPIDLTSLIQEVVKNMQMQIKEKSIFLRHESTGAIPLVIADEDKIKEVVINLIGNAIKFTSQGGITIKTEVQDDMVLTSVSDTGTGIHKEDFDLLFKKFSQVKRDQKYTKSYGGTGLGLYLSQKIVEGLGGKIWLDSEVGKGTTFFFTLPIVK